MILSIIPEGGISFQDDAESCFGEFNNIVHFNENASILESIETVFDQFHAALHCCHQYLGCWLYFWFPRLGRLVELSMVVWQRASCNLSLSFDSLSTTSFMQEIPAIPTMINVSVDHFHLECYLIFCSEGTSQVMKRQRWKREMRKIRSVIRECFLQIKYMLGINTLVNYRCLL